MIILQESSSAQNMNFIMRSFTSGATYNVVIKDEQKNKEIYNKNVTTITEVLYFNRLNAIFNVKQDNFYTLTIKSGETIVLKDKIFCTNQALTDYSINNAQYESNTTTNEFIFI